MFSLKLEVPYRNSGVRGFGRISAATNKAEEIIKRIEGAVRKKSEKNGEKSDFEVCSLGAATIKLETSPAKQK